MAWWRAVASTLVACGVGVPGGCGQGRPAAPPAAPVATAARDAGGSGSYAPADTIATTWEDLLGASHAVYLARFTVRTRDDGFNEWCVEPLRASHAPARSELPAKICTLVGDILGAPGPGYPGPAPGELGWVATRIRGGAEEILTVARDGCAPEGCPDPPRDELVLNLRCGQLEDFWWNIPEEHRACDRDDDCAALEAMCFEVAVAAGVSGEYAEVLGRFGGMCLNPVSGACPRFTVRAVCRDGACTTERVP